MKRRNLLSLSAVAVALSACLSACGGSVNSSAPAIAVPSGVSAAMAGYTVSVLAKAPGNLVPDDVIVHGGNLYVIAQDPNIGADGTVAAGTKPQSLLLAYDLKGNLIRQFNVPGHPDGLVEIDANTLWVSTNEDANVQLAVVDTSKGTVTTLLPDTAPAHGGGLDDMKLLNGVVYAAASHPTLGAATSTFPNGVSTVPALYTLTLNGDNKTFHLTPSFMGNATAVNQVTHKAVTLSLSDPDSMAIDGSGNLVLDSQADSELVFITSPGATQTATVLPLSASGTPSQVDDVRWAPSGKAFMVLADNKTQLIYKVTTSTQAFVANTIYASGKGVLWMVDSATGNTTPVINGLGAPKGIAFVPQ